MNNCLFYKNVRLVPYTKNHYEKTVKWLNDEEIKNSFGLTKSVTLQSHINWLNNLANTYIWAIYDNKNNYCGNILLFYNTVHYSVSFQIYLGEKPLHGKRLGYHALISIIDYTFHILEMHRIWLHVFPDNNKAIHVYEKLGFVKEGIERESHCKNNIFKDQLRYSILKNEWLQQKENF